jgi:SAM-dependent methyltransferase
MNDIQSDALDVAAQVERFLSCPISHTPLKVTTGTITSADPSFRGKIVDGVALMSDSVQPTFFDDKFETMQKGHEEEGEWAFCYAQQVALLSSYLAPGQVVLDIGCGPSLPYQKPPGVFVVGLEPSFSSIRANQQVDLRVSGTAAAIPMADASVDAIVCFYSVHHMVGKTVAATGSNVGRAFQEFGRVLKPNGLLFVFEMTPILPFYAVQSLLWNTVRKLAPNVLDMYFWSANSIADIARDHLPKGSMIEKIFFGTSAFTAIPPVFNLPWLKVPRLCYPLDAKLYKWTMRR